jgi:hypothetical protein
MLSNVQFSLRKAVGRELQFRVVGGPSPPVGPSQALA